MNLKDNVNVDLVCEWFDFLRSWINCDLDDHSDEDDDCSRVIDSRINGVSDLSDEDEGLPEADSCLNLSTPGLASSGKPEATSVTCFNCDDNFLFFGTNTGWIYCFPRGERQAKGPLYERHPVKCQLIGIEIPDENVVSLLLPKGFIMFNFVRNEIIYSWSIQRPIDGTNLPQMVTSKCIYDNSRHRYHVFTGDSFGTIRCHNVIEDETVTIFSEDQSVDSPHRHTVVQIDVYSSDLILVSSCFRSLILWKSISDSWSAVQIGQNVRKLCGQYGAVFNRDGNIVIASRPAMHLIKANTTDGSVVQTFRLKNVPPLKTLNLFKETTTPRESHFSFKSTATPTVSPAPSTLSLNGTTNVFNFGHLVPLHINDEEYICSWNSHSLSIVKLDGTLLVKEYSPVKIVDANVSSIRGFRDIIILREDWTIFRVRFVDKKSQSNPKTTEYGFGEVLRGTLGIQNLTNTLSIPTQALNSLEGEIKKIYTLMSDKIYESGEKLLNFSAFDQLNLLRRNSTMENPLNPSEKGETDPLEPPNDCDPELDESFFNPTSPLFIHEKISRKNSVNLRFELDSEKSEESVQFSRESPTRTSSISEVVGTTEPQSTKDEDEDEDKNEAEAEDDDEDEDEDKDGGEDEILTHDDGNDIDTNCPPIERSTSPINVINFDDDETIIISQESRRSVTRETFKLDGLELTKKFSSQSASSYASEIKTKMIREGENIYNNIEFEIKSEIRGQQSADTVDSVPTINAISSIQTTNDPFYSKREDSKIDSFSSPVELPCIPIRETRPIKHVEWQLSVENTHTSARLEINRFCASGFSDTESSVYVWLSCASKGRPKLVYYPDFESLRLPPGKNKSFTIGAIRNRVYLMNEENELWYREGVDEPGLVIGPVLSTLATRWTKVPRPKSSIQLVNFSLCTSDELGWFSDSKGNVWMFKLRTGSWVKIPHDSENRFHVHDVQICPSDSSMVWCIDNKNRLFVRAGIFNTRGDADEHISGMAWLSVHTPVQVTSIAVANTSVWILDSQSNRIFKRIGIQPPSSYVGTDWQEIKAPTLIKDSLKDISASLNGDIWLLTEQGSIWQVCDP